MIGAAGKFGPAGRMIGPAGIDGRFCVPLPMIVGLKVLPGSVPERIPPAELGSVLPGIVCGLSAG
jgi:hypothetical protein